MALVIVSFAGDPTLGPPGDAELAEALAEAKSLAPAGCRFEVRAFDRAFIANKYPQGGTPEIIVDDPERLPPAVSRLGVWVWMDDALDNLELKTDRLARALHSTLGAVSTGIFDTSRHLDLVGDGAIPTLQAVNVIKRRADLDRDTFMQYYRVHHVPLAKSLNPLFVRYTTYRLLQYFGEFLCDCLAVQEFASFQDLKLHMSARSSTNDKAGDDVGNFISELRYSIGERLLT